MLKCFNNSWEILPHGLQYSHHERILKEIIASKVVRSLVASIILVLLLPLASPLAVAQASWENRLLSALEELDWSIVASRAISISSLGSRMTGYEGYYRLVELIEGYLDELGVAYRTQEFEVAVPIDEGFTLEVEGVGSFKLYALWPNGVIPPVAPPEGIRGELVYVDSGDLEKFNGKNINGSIVLMKFNSLNNWVNALRLGAKAVIFIEPTEATYPESLMKFSDTPINFPRFYLKGADSAEVLKAAEKGARAVVKGRAEWREVKAINIVAMFNGTDRPDELVVLATHIDSWSVVPALASSANEAYSIASMMELVRLLEEYPPRRSVWLVFLSGHWQAMAGGREFVDWLYFSESVRRGELKPGIFIKLGPFSSDSDSIAIQISSFYAMTVPPGFTVRYQAAQTALTRYLNSELFASFIQDATGMNVTQFVKVWTSGVMIWNYEEYPYVTESELVLSAGGAGYTIMAAGGKLWKGVPISDIDSLRKERLRLQALAASYIALSYAYDPHFTVSGQKFIHDNFIEVRGRVLEFDVVKGWYSPVPKAIVRFYQVENRFPLAKIVVISDEEGRFSFKGIPPFHFVSGPVLKYWKIDAFKYDPQTGFLTHAPDLGIYGEQAVPSNYPLLTSPAEVMTVVVKGVPVEVIDPVDPRTMRLAQFIDPEIPYHTFLSGVSIVMPYDFSSRSTLLLYGSYNNGYEPFSVVLVPEGSRITIAVSYGLGARRPVAVLTNSTASEPEGNGILVTKPMRIYLPLRAALDMFYISSSRYATLSGHFVYNPNFEEFMRRAGRHLEAARRAFKQREYSKALGASLAAYAWVYRAYDTVMWLIDDAANTSFYFLFVIVVGSILLERVLVHSEGKKRILLTIVVGGFMLSIFYLIHPALAIMSNSFMGLLGVVLILIFVVTAGLMANVADTAIKELSMRVLGIHRIEVGRIGVASIAFSTAIENLRKRPIRTLLTFLTIIVTVMAMVAFTSTSVLVTAASVPRAAVPPYYEGVMVKNQLAIPPVGPLSFHLALFLEAEAGEEGVALV
ncbi:MAG: hypothetical protein DRJ43_02255, partial [Thermoprotei archaeon]